MKVFSHVLNSLPKRVAAGALVALAFALPMAVSAADMVQISATTGVANVTAGDTTYSQSVNATYDQIVKVEVTYDNLEAPGSGKVANNVNVKINIPSTPGQSQTVTTTTSGDNTNTVNGSVNVNLDRSDAYLQYIPGTAEANVTDTNGNITHETVANTPSLEDVVTSTGFAINNGNPCQAAAVAVEARVMIPGVKVVKQVEEANQTNQWSNNDTANPGDTLKYIITYQNTGNTQQNNVIIRDNLPAGMQLVPNTTLIFNSTSPNGVLDTSNNVTAGGLNIGNYGPNALAYVEFQVKVPSADNLTCGANTFRNVGVAQPENMEEFYNIAVTTVNKTCANVPSYTCDAFHVTNETNRTVKVDTFTTSQSNGATFNNVVINWGDNTPALTTNTAVGQTHQYAKDGTYTLSATAHFTVNGQDVTATGSCSQPVTFTTTTTPPTPTALVNTGAGNVVGLFAAVTVAGAFAHRLFLSRRLTQ